MQATNLFSFDQSSGYQPWTGIVVDGNGTIFGTNPSGGHGSCDGGEGCGTIYALHPPAKGSQSWSLDILYDFQNQGDGWFPAAPVTFGPHGSLFGYPSAGSYGTIFQLERPAKGSTTWTYNVLYTFSNNSGANLLNVTAPLVWHGNTLYGIASGGSNNCGQDGCGSVFQLSPPKSGNGTWAEKPLFSFTGGSTGGEPASIVASGDGKSLYVATLSGKGAVVELSPSGKGTWMETVLTTFNGGKDGSDPQNLLVAADGTIFGTGYNGNKGGFVFQLSQSNGAWTRTNIAKISFHHYGPVSLAFGPDNSLIGVTTGDVDFYSGNVFQLISSGGKWTVRQLWNFNRGPDRNPLNVVPGMGGHLFGVLNGGDSDDGSVYELK
jgi:hypothetical protein